MPALPSFPFKEGPRPYQVEALNAWIANGCRGFFAMATGTGKTVTALNCLLDYYKDHGRYRGLILVPTLSLVEQWVRELRKFNFTNVVKISSKERSWKDDITRITAGAYLNSTSSFIVISTYASFAKSSVLAWLEDLPSDTIVIADEAHNLGSPLLIQAMNRLPLKMRIGLSATARRQFDPIGNAAINRYFNISGHYTFEYSMKEAIANNVLCHYEYYPHLVRLNENEMESYTILSRKIAKFYHPDTDTFDDDPILTALLIKRKRIIHKAASKIFEFERIINRLYKEKGTLKYTMVYAPEGVSPSDDIYYAAIDDQDFIEEDALPMINIYTKIVSQVDSKITVEQFTSKDSDRPRILDDFTNGVTQVLVAMKCLDEGIDVPRAENAIFISSTGNPRQFVQRRGRILRTHPDKPKACIHDLVVAPYVEHTYEAYRMERSLIQNELRRVQDFASLADNPGYAQESLKEIVDYYGLNLFSDEQDR